MRAILLLPLCESRSIHSINDSWNSELLSKARLCIPYRIPSGIRDREDCFGLRLSLDDEMQYWP